MISINNLAVQYGARTLFEQATLNLHPGHCYGIVGANGAGKSTLLRVISGEEEATVGSVSVPQRCRIGVLGQDHFQYEDTPIIDVVMMGLPELWEAMQEKDEMLRAAAEDPEAFDVDRYGELEDVVLALDGYSFEARVADILEGLNIPGEVHREPLSVLSGGYKLRVLLAQTLASTPDVLLLDEPTNHLDIVSIAWLERFLRDFSGCTVVVSHDQRFLNTISTHIIDVDYERVMLYTGNYDQFEVEKAAERDRKEAEIEKQQARIAEHKKFIERFRAKATKARQAQSRAKQIDKIELEELPQSSRQYPRFRFGAERDTGRLVLDVEGVSKSFDDDQVLDDVSFQLMRGERMAIIGPNGIGKSTLLKIALGHLEADAGRCEWGHAAVPGYFSQDLGEMNDHADTTIHDWLWTFCPEKPTGFVRGKLAEVLFGKDDVDKKVGALSGGERARLAFARLGIQEPTVLVLDEPTNHLDLEGIEALADELAAYPNAMVFVSHDRWFVSRLATRVVQITEDGVEDFRGSYEEFLQWTDASDHLDHDAVVRAHNR
jgi:ATPase subunit of ABC transporter with duplicated ATPase domains